MTQRIALGVLVLCVLSSSLVRARALPGLDEGRLGPRLWVEIEVGDAGRSEAEAASKFGAVELVKDLANLPARAAGRIPDFVRAWRAASDASCAWHWAKQSLIEPLGRLHASQAESAEGSSDVEVETARSTVGEAVGWSPGELGWAVRTREHVMIIANGSEQRAAEMPTLWINRGIRDLSEDSNVAVFTSSTFSLVPSEEVPGLPQAEAGDGMEITAYRNEDSGIGFLVRISGPVVLHADNGDA